MVNLQTIEKLVVLPGRAGGAQLKQQTRPAPGYGSRPDILL
jgi:hypothetical protein